MKSLKSIIVISTLLTLSACSSNYVLSEPAKNIEFVDATPGKNCQFLGQAEGSRDTFFSGSKTHSELMRDAATDLLNKAAAMGGNVIHNAKDSSTFLISDLAPTPAKMTGDVYRCN